MNRIRTILFAAVISSGLLFAVPAGAATTVGSDLTAGSVIASDTCNPGPCTFQLRTLVDGSSGAIPSSGVITRWRLKPGGVTGATIAFRVLRSTTSINAQGISTVFPQTPITPGALNVFPTRIPVSAGDFIGLDVSTPSPSSVQLFNSGAVMTVNKWDTALVDGGVLTDRSSFFGCCELMLNADVEADADNDGYGDESQDGCPGTPGPISGCPVPPSNEFTIGALKLNKKRGTGTLTVTVPGPGKLSASGKTIKTSSATPANVGSVKLTIKAKGKAAKALKKKGKAKTSIKVSFTPTGGLVNTKTKSVTLKKKH